MPPTMILTCGWPAALVLAPARESRQADSAARARGRATSAASLWVRGRMAVLSFVRWVESVEQQRYPRVVRTGGASPGARRRWRRPGDRRRATGAGLQAGGGVALDGRAPGGQAHLDLADEPLGDQGDHGGDDHPGVDAGGVEVALGVVDEDAQALVGAGELADDRADEGEAEGDVQAGQDPGRGARQDDRAQHVPPAGAEDAGVVDEHLVDLARTLEGVEEDR